jgi:hypothetical protein
MIIKFIPKYTTTESADNTDGFVELPVTVSECVREFSFCLKILSSAHPQ